MAAPTVRSSAATLKTTETTTWDVALPPTVANGDMLTVFTEAPSGTLLTAPVGWTTVITKVVTTVLQGCVFARAGTTADSGGTVSLTSATSRRMSAMSAAMAGATSDPSLIVAASASGTLSTTTHTAGSVTTGGPDYLLLAAAGGTGNGQAYTAPSGYTEITDSGTATGTRDVSLTVATKAQASAGASGTAAFTASPGSIFTAIQIGIPSSATNVQPIAITSAGQVASPGSTVTLDGTASYDPDGTVTSYAWSCISLDTVVLSNAAAPQPTFVAPVTPCALTFQLVVTDNLGSTSIAAVTGVLVTAGHAPVTGSNAYGYPDS